MTRNWPPTMLGFGPRDEDRVEHARIVFSFFPFCSRLDRADKRFRVRVFFLWPLP